MVSCVGLAPVQDLLKPGCSSIGDVSFENQPSSFDQGLRC